MFGAVFGELFVLEHPFGALHFLGDGLQCDKVREQVLKTAYHVLLPLPWAQVLSRSTLHRGYVPSRVSGASVSRGVSLSVLHCRSDSTRVT